jgi:hypothetical protein
MVASHRPPAAGDLVTMPAIRLAALVRAGDGIVRIRHGVVAARESTQGEGRILLDQYERYVELLDAVFRAYQADSRSLA